ncbi:hypothetical protein OS347_000734 [Vibrio vulnificus]|nr:hypothetical protein [Vibrio vulnificus]
MKNTVIAITVLTMLAGCGKSEEEIKFEQQRELLLINNKHELRMEQEKAKQIAAEHQPIEFKDEQHEQSNDSHYPTSSNTDEGFGAGSMLLAGAVGAAAGYAISNNKDVITDKAQNAGRKIQEMNQSPKAVELKQKANAAKDKLKYQARKTKVLAKKAAKKAKNKIKGKK